MVPSGSVLSCLELVSHGVSRGNRALSNPWNAVILDVVELADTVPMYGCSVVFKVVGNMDHQVVTPVSDDGRTWNSAIERKRNSFIAIWGKSGVFD